MLLVRNSSNRLRDGGRLRIEGRCGCKFNFVINLTLISLKNDIAGIPTGFKIC
jgi:hypothetical protein